MKIGEQNLVRLEPAIFDRLRLLDLDDHVGVGEHGLCRGQDAGARLLVRGVVGEDAGASAGLHYDLVAARVSSRTEPGTSPTLNSLLLISVGTPMRMMDLRIRMSYLSWSETARTCEEVVGVLLSFAIVSRTIPTYFKVWALENERN